MRTRAASSRDVPAAGQGTAAWHGEQLRLAAWQQYGGRLEAVGGGTIPVPGCAQRGCALQTPGRSSPNICGSSSSSAPLLSHPTFLREDDLVDDDVAAVNLKLGQLLRSGGGCAWVGGWLRRRVPSLEQKARHRQSSAGHHVEACCLQLLRLTCSPNATHIALPTSPLPAGLTAHAHPPPLLAW